MAKKVPPIEANSLFGEINFDPEASYKRNRQSNSLTDFGYTSK